MSDRTEIEAVEEFNKAYPVGTVVRYWTGAKEGPGRTGKTRSKAHLFGGHTAVVWVMGLGSCVALSHIVVEPDREPLEAAEVSAQKIAKTIGGMLPKGWKFTLVLASVEGEGFMTYVSNLERSGSIAMLRELADSIDGGEEV